MKILVTGGAGFIGSHFIRHILRKYPEYSITNLDKLTYAGNLDNVKDVVALENYHFVKGDIADPEIVDTCMDSIDVIVNFAAETHVDRSIAHAGTFVMTNVYGTYCLLEAARKYKVSRYIQISTDEVYGSVERGSCKETNALNPSNPYSSTKSGADLLVRSYFKTYGLPVMITRSSNNFGPYQFPEKVIPLFVVQALENKMVPLYGNGQNVRDWLYVLDNCEAIDYVLHKGKDGEVYNIGGGNECTNLELTRRILEMLDKKETLIQMVPDRLGHDLRYAIDSYKIRTELGWKPKYDFAKALEETIMWYRDNQQWWKNILAKKKKNGDA